MSQRTVRVGLSINVFEGDMDLWQYIYLNIHTFFFLIDTKYALDKE